MLFSDYVEILKNHLKRKKGQKWICDLLFSFVTDYAEAEEGEVIPIDIGKDRISKMMNGKEEIPLAIRNHICDDPVNDQLIMSFEKNIIPLLVDDYDDLFFQLMQKIENDNISPSRKASFKRMANEKTIAAFLVDVFVYAVMSNVEGANVEKEPAKLPIDNRADLTVKGILDGKKVVHPVIRKFKDRIGYTRDDILYSIRELLDNAKKIYVPPYKEPENTIFGALRGQQYKYNENRQKTINGFCKCFEYSLPDDFFEMGDIHTGLLPFVDSRGGLAYSLEGSQEAKDKRDALDAVYDAIMDGIEKAPFTKEFSDCFYIELLVENTGTNFDEDVRVTLRFPKGTIVTDKDIISSEDAAVKYFVNKAYETIRIERGEDYLSYDETSHDRSYRVRSVAFGDEPDVTNEDVKDLLMYYIVTNDKYDVVEIKFDSINQHTAVAFPNVILLKNNNVDAIEYTIKSKKSPDLIDGKMIVKKNENS